MRHGELAQDLISNVAPARAINSYDEWSSLKEVIVGSPLSYEANELDLSFKVFYADTAYSSFGYPTYKKKSDNSACLEQAKKRAINKRYLEELNEDVEGFVDALEKEGVKVFRPIALKEATEFKTPYWNATGIPALNVRDQAIIFGDELVETSPQVRARYFESDLLKPIFYRYFNLGSKWTCMPKPVMTDHSFDLSYAKDIKREMVATEVLFQQSRSDFDVGFEILFDGAQCIRFGKDVLVNVTTQNHELGFEWLQQHLGSKFRLHKVFKLTDNHIDSMILPLRPGTLLLRSAKYLKFLPDFLRKWDIIYPPEPQLNIFPNYESDDLVLTSKYIDLNVLSLDENKVVVNSLFPELIATLEKNGFTVIPVRHRHRRIFGGGFHCFTLDTVRESSLEDYR
ncbi:MAG: glycine amidinotransferase [Proteobacteria bacterium]|nr:glycine amidinotransferase [Pseudomonadota bacterium]